MYSLTVRIQDGYINDFLSYVEQNPNISVENKNLEFDPYFFERRKRLQKLRNDIKNNKVKLLSEEEAEKEIDLLFAELEK